MYSRTGFDCEIPIKSRNHSQFVKLKYTIRPLDMLTWATCQVDTHQKQKCNFFSLCEVYNLSTVYYPIIVLKVHGDQKFYA